MAQALPTTALLAGVPTVAVMLIALSGLGILIGSLARSQQGFQMFKQMLAQELAMVGGLGDTLVASAIWAFTRQE